MATDFLKVLREVRGTGAPDAVYTDGIYWDIAIKDYAGHSGMYGHMQHLYDTVEGSAADISEVAQYLPEILDVHADLPVINAVDFNSPNINTVATMETAVNSVYADKMAIDGLYSSKAAIDSLYTDKVVLDSLYTDKVILDSIYADKISIDAVYASLANINSVGNSILDVTTVAINIDNVNITADNIGVIHSVSTNIASVIDAEANAVASAASATAAAISETTAGVHALNAFNSANAADTSATASALSATDANDSETLSREWAVQFEDIDITGNLGSYSALHHSAKSADSAALALTSETAALASEIAAGTSETNAGTSETNAAASATASSIDAAATAADVITTSASEAAAAASASAALASDGDAELEAWESEAASLTSEAYATTTEDFVVSTYTSNGLGGFTATPTLVYSSLHYNAKAQVAATSAIASATSANTSAINAAASEVATGLDATATAADVVTTTANALTATTGATTATAKASEAATSAFNASTSETNAAASELASANSATSSATSASASASSAIASDLSKTAAQTAETNALLAETGAITAQTGAETAATTAVAARDSALVSEIASEAAQVASSTAQAGAELAESNTEALKVIVETIYDNYDDRYLGSFTEANEPILDNDGALLIVGATYWNSTSNVLRFYNGVAWEDPVAAASQSATDAANSAAAAAASATTSSADAIATAADVVSTNADALSTSLDVIATNADVVTTNADAITTTADATASAISAANATVSETNADTSEAMAEEWANKNEDLDITGFIGVYSAKHHAIKAGNSSASASVSETNAASSEANAATSASNASTSEINAAGSATTATSAAAAAAISEANSLTYSSNSLASSTAAASSATSAATSETNAGASATAAAGSASAANISALAAAASEDSATASATSATASALSATSSAASASSSASNASISAAAALASETAAGLSEGIASTAATAASASETAAATSASNALASETAADTSATTALAAQVVSETARDEAAASADFVDDLFLGAKLADPALDNDGNILQVGCMYYNTALDPNQIKIWDGTVWNAAVFDATGAVLTFNGRDGAVTLTLADIESALGYTVYEYSLTEKTKLGLIEDGATADQVASEVLMANVVGAPTHATNMEDHNGLVNSSGVVSGGELTDNLNGTVSMAVSTTFLRTTEDPLSPLYVVEIPELLNMILVDGVMNYIYADWNGGAVRYVSTAIVGEINCQDKCLIYLVHREGNTLHIVDDRQHSIDVSRKVRAVFKSFSYFIHSGSGSVLSEPAALALAVTAGEFYYTVTSLPHIAFDTSIIGTAPANVFTLSYRDGLGGWTTELDQKLIDTTLYDDGTGIPIAILGNNNFGVSWIYMVHSKTESDVHVIMGQEEYLTQADAENASLPVEVPTLIAGLASLIGFVVYEKGNTVFNNVLSAFTQTFTSATASSHNALSGLQGGSVDEYYHVTAAQITEFNAFGLELDGKVDDAQVLTDVPLGALFTDTIYTHPATHSIAEIVGLQTELDGKVDDAQVLTNVPLGAVFTDTLYDDTAVTAHIGTILGNPHNVTQTDVGLGNVDNTSDIAKPISTATQLALNDKVDDSQVLTNVPAGAVFTDTLTTVTDNLLSISSTDALSANQGKVLKGLIDSIETVLTSNDIALDEIQEIVDFIKANKATLDSLGIANIIGLQAALDGKIDDAQVLTNVPLGALFTDTVYNDTAISAAVTLNTAKITYPSADSTKLAGIETSATADQTGAEIKLAYEAVLNTNAYTDTEKTKLLGIEIGATADQTGAEIATVYEGLANTNKYTDTAVSKLNTIEANATADQTGAEIKTAYEAELNTNVYTDTEKSKLASIESSANNYTLPVATDLILGGVKGGTNIVIDGSGELSIVDDSHNHVISNVDGLQIALDSKVDENILITPGTATKVTYDAKGLITSATGATTADIPDSFNRRYITDADLVLASNTSGVNTGDQDLSGLVPKISAQALHAVDALSISGHTITLTKGDNTIETVVVPDNDTTYVSGDFNHDALTGFVADEHIDWSLTNLKNIHSDNYTNSTYVSGDFDHDSLIGFVANEHIDWTADQGVTNIHPGNYTDTNTTYVANDFAHDSLSGVSANEHIDWTVDQGITNIHAGNYLNTDTTYVSADFNHDSLTGFVANEHIDWSLTNIANIHPDNYTDTNTTYVSGDFNHDSLTGFVANEHIDWTADQGVTDIHPNNYTDTNTTYVSGDFTHDSLAGVIANEHIDWTVTSAANIHADNYTNTTYTSSSFVHDDLTGFVANEHIDWTVDQGAINVHANNVVDTNVSTNLGYTASSTNGVVTSSDGTNATLPLGTAINAGLLSPAQFSKLELITITQAANIDTLVSNQTGSLLTGEIV